MVKPQLYTKARGIEFDPYLSEPHESRNAHHEKYLKSRFNPTKIYVLPVNITSAFVFYNKGINGSHFSDESSNLCLWEAILRT